MRFKDLIPPWWEWEKIVNYLLGRDHIQSNFLLQNN
jgi:hypothetical protein